MTQYRDYANPKLNELAGVPMETKSAIEVKQLGSLKVAKVDDFKPSKAKRDEMAGNKIADPPRSNTMTEVIQDGADFMSAEKTAEHVSRRTSLIKQVANEIWEQQEEFRKQYAEAKEIVDKMTPAELESPSGKQRRAMTIVEKRAPLSKDEVIAKAKRRVMTGDAHSVNPRKVPM